MFDTRGSEAGWIDAGERLVKQHDFGCSISACAISTNLRCLWWCSDVHLSAIAAISRKSSAPRQQRDGHPPPRDGDEVFATAGFANSLLIWKGALRRSRADLRGVARVTSRPSTMTRPTSGRSVLL